MVTCGCSKANQINLRVTLKFEIVVICGSMWTKWTQAKGSIGR